MISHADRTESVNPRAESRAGVIVSSRTWLPTADQLTLLEASWAPSLTAQPLGHATPQEAPASEFHS